ncbi:hypothetical protein ASG85_14510 [Paenibacillus sp. Soil724D2]|nr:hypothetical protein ASG85_14510 [Paenibacillus sp. Soil724D2]
MNRWGVYDFRLRFILIIHWRNRRLHGENLNRYVFFYDSGFPSAGSVPYDMQKTSKLKSKSLLVFYKIRL